MTLCSGADRHGLDHDYANNLWAQGQMSHYRCGKVKIEIAARRGLDRVRPTLLADYFVEWQLTSHLTSRMMN